MMMRIIIILDFLKKNRFKFKVDNYVVAEDILKVIYIEEKKTDKQHTHWPVAQ